MKKKLPSKCIMMLGLLLFLTLLVPCLPMNTVKAQAASTEKDKNDTYRLNVKSVFIAKGKSFTLKAYNTGENAKVHFKSDDPEIASVNGDGVVFANKLGTANITVIIKDGSDSTSLTCEVNVGPPAISVKWTQSIVIIGIDSSDTLKVILKPSETAEDAKFSSKKDEIVSISPGGRISGNRYGMTYLFAEIDETDSDGKQKYDTCAVIVVSQENVSKLDAYFTKHTELNRISEADLNSALYKYFNDEPDRAESSSLISNLDRYLNKEFDLD